MGNIFFHGRYSDLSQRDRTAIFSRQLWGRSAVVLGVAPPRLIETPKWNRAVINSTFVFQGPNVCCEKKKKKVY